MRPWFFFSPSGSGGPTTYSVDFAGYQLYTYSMAAPAGATSLTFQLRFYGGTSGGRDSIWIDDASLWGYQPSGNAPPTVGPTVRIPAGFVYPTDDVVVKSTMIDSDGHIVLDSLYYQLNAGGFTAISHDSLTGDDYWFYIGMHPLGTVVDYYAVAIDDSLTRVQSQTFSYTVVGEASAHTPIYAIQHTITQGSLPNCFPSDSLNLPQTITGIVVGRYERTGGTPPYRSRFLMQDATSLWSGINVYFASDTVQIGDSVTVTGTILEYFAETELQAVSAFTNHSSGHTLPGPAVVSCATFSADSCSATAEPYEGMYIQLNNITIGDSSGYGGLWAYDATGESTIVGNDLFRLGDNPPTIEIGHTYSYIRGVGRYIRGRYRINPRFASDVYSAPTSCTGGNIFNVQFTFSPGVDTADCWPSDSATQYVTICGIVTAVTQGSTPRFYLQDQANTTWGGVYCFDYTLPSGDTVDLAVGDYVQATARVHEYYGWTELDTLSALTVLGTGQALPDTTVITVANLVAMCDYTTEPYEDVLVRINNAAVTSDNGFDEMWIRDASSLDSIRIDSDLWQFGIDQPSPLPAPGSTYDWIIGVAKWQGRQGAGYERGWVILPRFASDYHQSVFTEPEFADIWSVNSTTIAATFDRVMRPAEVENPSNYSTTHGLSITAAVLSTDGRKVTLTTGSQPNNLVDSLVAINLCDNLGTCMTVQHFGLFHSGITPISSIQTPAADGDTSQFYGEVVTFKGVIVSDSTMAHPTNSWVNDQSGPPYNGVLVYTGGLTGAMPMIGDTATITGRIEEYFRATEISGLGTFNNVVINNSGPEPIPFEATVDAINANLEGFEGVLVTICDSFTVINDAFDTYGFLVENGSHDSLIVHRQPPQHTRYSYVPVNGTIINGITGVFKFQRDQFRISPRRDSDFNSYATWCGGTPGCNYVAGDINGNGSANGIDVTFGVSYFKGGTPPPVNCGNPVGPCPQASPFYAAGDVNGNCAFNGIDITFYVAYLKGLQPALRNCETCPPATLAAPVPETPTLIPALKSKSAATSGGME
jgi:hypothetical protein